MECVDGTSDDGLPKWARANNGASVPDASMSELPKWAREADSDPAMSPRGDGLPNWATKCLTEVTGEKKKDGDDLESESAKISSYAEEPSSESDGLKLACDGDITKQSGDITRQSIDTVTHPVVTSTEQPLAVSSGRHPSDSTVGDQIYPDRPDGEAFGYLRDHVEEIEQHGKVAASSASDAPQVAPPTGDAILGSDLNHIPSTIEQIEPSVADVRMTSIGHDAHDGDEETEPKAPQEIEMHRSETTCHESVSAVTKPSFFGHVSQLASIDYTISVPKTKPPETMRATTESSQSKDFIVQCHRRRYVDGQSVNAETQEMTAHRPIIKINRRFGASTESEYVDANIAKMKRFRELNRHDKHSSDSSIQTLLYGKTFGVNRDAQLVDEGMYLFVSSYIYFNV